MHYMPEDRDILWLYKKLGHFGARANDVYKFDLLGMTESLQYTEYDQPTTHYDFHMDFGAGSLSRRKLSLVLQLSEPTEYGGGMLQLLDGNQPQTVEKGLGHIVAFPSFTLHRVTPVISGYRVTLVCWINGLTSYK
jgi:PKHD-type hydroxylase